MYPEVNDPPAPKRTCAFILASSLKFPFILAAGFIKNGPTTIFPNEIFLSNNGFVFVSLPSACPSIFNSIPPKRPITKLSTL